MNYITPCSGLSDREAIQQAVNTAAEKDIRTVVIPATKIWQLEEPVSLPSGVTVILDGAQIQATGTAFVNSNAYKDDTLCLGGEQENIHLLGTKSAAIHGGNAPQIYFRNVKAYGISGMQLTGGEGIKLMHCRYGKVQKLQFSHSRYGVFLGEGCNNNILCDLLAETKEEAILWHAEETAVWGRSTDMYDSVLCRLDAKTDGAPAVALHAGSVVANNLFIRDITDRTEGDGVTIRLGDTGNTELLDLTVRNVATSRTAAAVSDNCDGVYLGNLSTVPFLAPGATRVLVDDRKEAIEKPQLCEYPVGDFVDANDPSYWGANDYETLQNAINQASGKTLVIPRRNARTGKAIWDVENTLRIPSDTTVILLDAHLRLTDFTYCNLFSNAQKPAQNIHVLGVGSATVDSGKFNGLKEKNANTLGFGPITDNALLLFDGVDGLVVENLHMVQNRWFCLFCVGCKNGRLVNLDLCAQPNFPDMGGIRIHSGCQDFLVENITGLTGEDTVVIAAEETDGVFAPENKDISHIQIRTVKANASRTNILRIQAHNGGIVQDILAETLLDCSLPEQKKLPFSTVLLGDTTSKNLQNIRIRDLNGRSAATVQLGGESKHISLSNIHSYGSSDNALRTFPLPETYDYLLSNILMEIAEAGRGYRATLQDFQVNGIFFRCQQASRYMRGTATSIITDKKKFLGTVVELRNCNATNVHIDNVLSDRVGNGIRVTGNAHVDVTNFHASEIGRAAATCGSSCLLTVNGETIPVKATQAL